MHAPFNPHTRQVLRAWLTLSADIMRCPLDSEGELSPVMTCVPCSRELVLLACLGLCSVPTCVEKLACLFLASPCHLRSKGSWASV